MKKVNALFCLVVAVLIFVPGALFSAGKRESAAADTAGFYKGNEINMIINMSPGGGFDRFGRILARYIEKHTGAGVKVHNVAGGGGLIGMNRLYVSPSDGLTMGFVVGTTAILGKLRGLEGMNFELDKYEFLGRHNYEPKGMYVNTGSGMKNFRDVLKASGLKIGTSGTGSGDHQAQSVIMSLLGVDATVITGYGGTAELYMALARNEIDLTQGSGSGALGSVQSGVIRPVLIYTKGVPEYFKMYNPTMITELGDTEHKREVLNALTALYEIERIFAFPPGTDAAKVAYMREIFANIAKDPDFLGDCKKANVDIEWASGEEIEKIVKQMTINAEILRPFLDL